MIIKEAYVDLRVGHLSVPRINCYHNTLRGQWKRATHENHQPAGRAEQYWETEIGTLSCPSFDRRTAAEYNRNGLKSLFILLMTVSLTGEQLYILIA